MSDIRMGTAATDRELSDLLDFSVVSPDILYQLLNRNKNLIICSHTASLVYMTIYILYLNSLVDVSSSSSEWKKSTQSSQWSVWRIR